MTWDAFHRRGEVLRHVLAHAEAHRDGELPMQLPGVAETFGDELALLGALQLRWHTHLAGVIERELIGQPLDLEAAVMRAWRTTAQDLLGVREILDAATEAPRSQEMAEVLDTAHRKDWTLMAAMAGRSSPSDHGAARVGREIERRARAAYRPVPRSRRRAETPARGSILDRVRAHLAA